MRLFNSSIWLGSDVALVIKPTKHAPSDILAVFVYFPSQDSGQAIPRVVESCIRYINLYGECAAVQRGDIWRLLATDLHSAKRDSVDFRPLIIWACARVPASFTSVGGPGKTQMSSCLQQRGLLHPAPPNIPGDAQLRLAHTLHAMHLLLNQVGRDTRKET